MVFRHNRPRKTLNWVLAAALASLLGACGQQDTALPPPDDRAPLALTNSGAIRTDAAFTANALPPNDDSFTSLVDIGFSLNFFGSTYDRLYVNNNGNVTFDTVLSTYTPFDLTSTGRVIIAPFFGDVDTRAAGSEPVVYGYGTGVIDGRTAFGVNWVNVGYYYYGADKLNSFQLVLIDRSDIAPGDFDIEFNYAQIQWETGDASGGSGGLGGNSARAGYSNGTGDAGTFFELPGSAVNGAFLDSNTTTGLIHNSLNSSQPGRYLFEVRSGVVVPVDETPPVIGVDVAGTPGNDDWYTSDVTVTWTVTDEESEITTRNGCEPLTLIDDTTSDGASYTCSATSAGGTSEETVTFKRDATPPTVSLDGVGDGDTYTLGTEPTEADLACVTSDSGSGVAADATLEVTGGNQNGVGTFTATCTDASDAAGNTADPVEVSYEVHYAFDGFFHPVDNLPSVNRMRAGRAVPIKFSLAGDQGLQILDGAPTSRPIACDTSAPSGEVEETTTTGNSSLQYDATSDEYTYVWSTNRGWSRTCREFTLTLHDGTTHTAHFQFQ